MSAPTPTEAVATLPSPASGGGEVAAIAFLAMIERAARDPTINVDKLDRLLQMRERENARVAEQAFNAALADAQTEMQPVAADSDNPQTRSRYASYAALDRTVRPIYTKHGFGLTFNTNVAPASEQVRILCDVTHARGHTRRYHVDMPVDGKGARGGDVMTKTHAMGSGISYGMRYLLRLIFNLAIDQDDDGNAAGGRGKTIVPATKHALKQGGDGPTLPKKDCRDIYTKLQAEIDTQPSAEKLEAWAFANEQQFLVLPKDWQEIITLRYQERIVELRQGPQKTVEGVAHDADGVVWEEDGERPATPEDFSKGADIPASAKEMPAIAHPTPPAQGGRVKTLMPVRIQRNLDRIAPKHAPKPGGVAEKAMTARYEQAVRSTGPSQAFVASEAGKGFSPRFRNEAGYDERNPLPHNVVPDRAVIQAAALNRCLHPMKDDLPDHSAPPKLDHTDKDGVPAFLRRKANDAAEATFVDLVTGGDR